MSQLADPMMVNEVSRVLLPHPLKPAGVRPGVSRSRVVGCSGVVSAAGRSQVIGEFSTGAESATAPALLGKGLLAAFWLTVIGGFAVVAWQVVLLLQAPAAPQVLLPWAR
ncbi:MAG: hypothetical protein LBH11_00870 [Propionibacteriaceae bacterium]|jgi:hypothetical protein|nr:hypothetical protein [Propionibacteriaceae bacterium]